METIRHQFVIGVEFPFKVPLVTNSLNALYIQIVQLQNGQFGLIGVVVCTFNMGPTDKCKILLYSCWLLIFVKKKKGESFYNYTKWIQVKCSDLHPSRAAKVH